MPSLNLPTPVAMYFQSKFEPGGAPLADIFTEGATVHDVGEDQLMTGRAEIEAWQSGFSSLKLTTELHSAEPQKGGVLVHGVVSGDFPGSPYAFDYTFTLEGNRIRSLVIDPIGPVGA